VGRDRRLCQRRIDCFSVGRIDCFCVGRLNGTNGAIWQPTAIDVGLIVRLGRARRLRLGAIRPPGRPAGPLAASPATASTTAASPAARSAGNVDSARKIKAR
jgi:hypothetical protein